MIHPILLIDPLKASPAPRQGVVAREDIRHL